MRLTEEELTRIERMFAEGVVRSDPPSPSATDRLMDAMIERARARGGVRGAFERAVEPAREQTPGSVDRRLEADQPIGKPTARSVVAALDWNTPRTLAELIEIRRVLMRSEALDR